MRTENYQDACQRPDVFSRPALEETLRVLQAEVPELVPLIEQALVSKPIEKPQQHRGEPWTDFLRIHIGYSHAEMIRDGFVSQECNAVSPDGSTTALASHYADLADVWTRYMIWLEDSKIIAAPSSMISLS